MGAAGLTARCHGQLADELSGRLVSVTVTVTVGPVFVLAGWRRCRQELLRPATVPARQPVDQRRLPRRRDPPGWGIATTRARRVRGARVHTARTMPGHCRRRRLPDRGGRIPT